jgi:type II secretion system protein H
MRLIPSIGGSRLGFTLIELMVVLVIIGIMTAMIIPEMKGTYEDAVLRSGARDLVNVFNLASSHAVTLNQLHRVQIDTKTGRYFVEKRGRQADGGTGYVPIHDLPGGEGGVDPRISIELQRPGDGSSDASEQDSPPAARDELSIRDRDEAIAFYPDGTADAWEIHLRDRAGFQLALRINPITARVHIIELEHK